MFEWFKTAKAKEAELKKSQQAREDLKSEILIEIEKEKEAKLEKERLKKIKEKEKIKQELKERENDDPFVEVKAIVHDPEKGIRIDLDWNGSFITYLKQNGYTGINDEAIIQKYILTLTDQITEDMNSGSLSEFG